MNNQSLNEFVKSIEGKTVTLIYNYSNVRRLEDLWYDRWKSDVILLFAQAIESLGANVRYLDIDTYLKVIIDENAYVGDYLVNLHTGIKDISIWPMIPSLASWRGIPIAPCSADAHIVNGRKDITNAIIQQTKLLSPENWDGQNLGTKFIAKPRDLGCSIDTIITKSKSDIQNAISKNMIVQRFIRGTEVVIGVVALPNDTYEVLGAHKFVVHNSENPNDWVYSQKIKISNDKNIFSRVPIELDKNLVNELRIFCKKLSSSSTFRIDARIETESHPIDCAKATIDNCYILEVNETPDPSPNGGYIKLWQDGYKKIISRDYCKIDRLNLLEEGIKPHAIMIALQLYYAHHSTGNRNAKIT